MHLYCIFSFICRRLSWESPEKRLLDEKRHWRALEGLQSSASFDSCSDFHSKLFLSFIDSVMCLLCSNIAWETRIDPLAKIRGSGSGRALLENEKTQINLKLKIPSFVIDSHRRFHRKSHSGFTHHKGMPHSLALMIRCVKVLYVSRMTLAHQLIIALFMHILDGSSVIILTLHVFQGRASSCVLIIVRTVCSLQCNDFGEKRIFVKWLSLSRHIESYHTHTHISQRKSFYIFSAWLVRQELGSQDVFGKTIQRTE